MAKQFSLSVTARSAGSRHEIYGLLVDSSTWAQWTPFSKVTLVEEAPGGGEGVGSVKKTTFRGMTGRERIVALVPDRQFSYTYTRGVFTPSIRDYVSVVDLDDDDGGTSIHWHSTYYARFPGSGWLPSRSLSDFLQRCADGLAAAAASHSIR